MTEGNKGSNKILENYVNDLIQKGYKKKDIRAQLLKGGYDKILVNKYVYPYLPVLVVSGIILIVMLLVIVTVAGFVLLYEGFEDNVFEVSDDCYTIREDIINGNSLSGVVENGDVVTILVGYYECNPIERGDFVIYNYSGNENPVIKIAKGIEGDKFELIEGEVGWNIYVNGEVLKNSYGEEYSVNDVRYNLLSLYEQDYGEEIPEDVLFILGNVASGSTDGTKFGFVHIDDVIGKAELNK